MGTSERFAAGAALAIGLVASSVVGARALVRIKSQDQSISVTGSAKRRIRSDLVIWKAELSARAPEISPAYKSLAADVPRVTAYLAKKGIAPAQIVVSSVSTNALHPKMKDGESDEATILGYEMTQTIEVRSSDVDKVTQVSREATELINQGIRLDSNAPEYHYTKLGDLKIQMLGEAARDAKVRAEQIAASTGSHVGSLRSARMGVMQINAADSSDTSDTGVNDTASIDKDVMAVVTSSFAIE